jgi:tetratricopeptide (TPR) repeat protein
MKDAAIEEQLKGIDYYEKYLEIFKETNKRKWVYSVIELAELLYDRAETSEDYVPIVSCLQAIEDYNSYRYTRHKSLLLMGKIYFKEGKFGLAQSYLQNIIQDNRKHLFSHYQATYYLTRIDELLEKKDMQMICNGYKNICNGVFNNFLKALAAQSWAQALFKLYQEKNFDEQKIGLVQRIFQQAQFHYEAHLKNTSTINDYHKCSIANALREIHNQLEMLKKMQSEQSNQKTFSLSSVVKKRSAEQELTQSLKRRKEK